MDVLDNGHFAHSTSHHIVTVYALRTTMYMYMCVASGAGRERVYTRVKCNRCARLTVEYVVFIARVICIVPICAHSRQHDYHMGAARVLIFIS